MKKTLFAVLLGLVAGICHAQDIQPILFPDRPGALFDALAPFKDEQTSLHIAGSCPAKKDADSKECTYCFLVDLVGHLKEEKVVRLLNKLRTKTISLVPLGSYPRGIAPSLEELAAECKKD